MHKILNLETEKRVRFCQQDIFNCESGKPSSVCASRTGYSINMNNNAIDELIKYRAFPPSAVALNSYERIVEDYPSDVLIDIGSGIGTSTLSLCLAACEATKVLCIEPNVDKMTCMFEYLDYCGLTTRVQSITLNDINSIIDDQNSSCLAFIDCWPLAIPQYLHELSRLPPCINLMLIFEASTGSISNLEIEVLAKSFKCFQSSKYDDVYLYERLS